MCIVSVVLLVQEDQEKRSCLLHLVKTANLSNLKEQINFRSKNLIWKEISFTDKLKNNKEHIEVAEEEDDNREQVVEIIDLVTEHQHQEPEDDMQIEEVKESHTLEGVMHEVDLVTEHQHREPEDDMQIEEGKESHMQEGVMHEVDLVRDHLHQGQDDMQIEEGKESHTQEEVVHEVDLVRDHLRRERKEGESEEKENMEDNFFVSF